MFRQLGVDIDTVKSTEEALKALRQGAYDVIVSNMVLAKIVRQAWIYCEDWAQRKIFFR